MAARYWVGGGSSANWNATGNTNWAATSGGAGNQSVPGVADDVTFDGAGASGNSNSTISATISCKTLTITSGYTVTMTHNAVLTIGGNWDYANSYTIAGSSGITISATSTITSNGKTWPNNLVFSTASTTKTLVGDLTINGLLSWASAQTINRTTSEILYVGGGLTSSSNSSGSITIELTGGTWSGAGAVVPLRLNGNITVSGTVRTNSSITYVSGTITTTGSSLEMTTGSPTLDCNGMSWNNLISTSATTVSLTSNLNLTGAISTNSTFTINAPSGQTVTVANGLSLGNASSAITGTAEIIVTGGTIATTSTGAINSSLTLNGNITISNATSFRYGTGTLKYLSGTITVSGVTLILTSGATLDVSAITWPTVTINSGTTYTLTSALNVSGTFTIAANSTFAGSAGFNTATLICTATGATTITLKNGITYTITSTFTCKDSRIGSIVLFTSDHASNRANLVMGNPSACNLLANLTRIDASGGRTINTFNGTVTDCVNVREFHDLSTTASMI